MAEVFRWKILADLDKSGALRSLNSLFKGMDKGVAQEAGKTAAQGTNPAGSTTPQTQPDDNKNSPVLDGIKSISSTISKGLKGVGSLLGTVGKIAAGVLGAIGIFKALQPTFQLIGQITSLMAELLRPINDAFMMLIMPVFQMLRPIVSVLNTLMMPFRRMAMEGSAAAGSLIGEGTRMQLEGEEGGGELIKEGMKGALQSASLMFSGFIDVIFTPLADAMGLGDRFAGAMDKWQSSAMKGVTRVIVLEDTFRQFAKSTGDNSEAVSEAMAIIDEQVAMIERGAGGFSMENINNVLDGIQGMSTFVEGHVTGDIDKIKKGAEQLNTPVELLQGHLFGAAVTGGMFANKVTDITDAMKKMSDFDAGMFQQGHYEQIQGSAEDKPSKIGSFFRGYMDEIKSFSLPEHALNIGTAGVYGGVKAGKAGYDNIGDERADWAKNITADIESFKSKYDELPPHMSTGLQHILDDAKVYMGESLIPDAFNSGLNHMLTDTNKMFGEEGNIVSKYSRGLKRMTTTTDSFATAIGKVATAAEDALTKVEKWIRKYNSAMGKVERLENKLASRRDMR